ncbi:unnamed protein product [Ectocarpus sp. 6 AP-2014]
MACKAVEYAEQDLTGVLNGLSALSLATGPHRRRDRQAAAPAHVLVVDGNMREDALVDLARSVDEVLSKMDPEALISLVVFTGVVSVYRLGRSGAAVADVLPGGETLSDQDVDRRLSEGEKDHFVPVRGGRESLCTILKLLRGVGDGTGATRPGQGSKQQQAGLGNGPSSGGGDGGRGGRGGALGRRKAWAARRRVPVPAHRRRRCLGAAVEYALSMGNPTNSVGGNGLGRTHHRLVTGRADPRTSLALYFGGPPKPKNKTKKRAAAAAAVGSVSRNEDEHVVFQFVIRRSSPAGDGRVTRVVTHRLPVTDDGHGFLQTVDPEALSVLIGKEAVLRATFGTESGTNQHEVEEARVAVDTVVQEVSSRFRDFRKRQPAAAAAAAAPPPPPLTTTTARRRRQHRSRRDRNYRRRSPLP